MDPITLNPSDANIWGPSTGCHAFPLISQGYPQEETEDMKKGKAINWLGAEMLRAKLLRKSGMPLRNVTTPEGVSFDYDMYDSAQIYARDAIRVIEKFSGKDTVLSIKIPMVSSCIAHEQRGTPDCVFSGKDFIHIWEFSNRHTPQPVFPNYKIINYLAMCFQGDGYTDQKTKVYITIVQPSVYTGEPIQKWNGVMSDLRAYINTLSSSAGKCYAMDPKTCSGAHCRFCPARFECAAAINSGLMLYEAAGLSSQVSNSSDVNILSTNYTIVSELFERIKTIKNAMNERLMYLIKSGRTVPGRSIEPTYGRTVWNASPEEIELLGATYDISLRKDEFITPRQATKAGIPEEVIKQFCKTPLGAGRLVETDITKLRKVFYGKE